MSEPESGIPSGRSAGAAEEHRATATPEDQPRSKVEGGVTIGLMALLSTVFFLYLLVPILALIFHAPPSTIWEQMKQPDVIRR